MGEVSGSARPGQSAWGLGRTKTHVRCAAALPTSQALAARRAVQYSPSVIQTVNRTRVRMDSLKMR